MRLEPGRDAVHDCLHIGEEFSLGTGLIQRANHIFRIEPLGFRNPLLLVNPGENDAVSQAQALYQITFEHLAAEGVRTWFEDRPQTRLRINGA